MANRFWVAPPVTGAIVSIASPPQIRLTVNSTGMTTGDVRTVSGIVGTTEANGTWTITVIDGTHIDLQGTTFTNLYTSGGQVVGKWDATNTSNWVTTSGGTNYGQTVPGTSDAVTFDGSSGGGTVTPNVTISVQSITCGAFTGTLAFNTNNNNVTLSSAFVPAGSGTRTINLGNGTWELSATAATTIWDMSTTTGLTFNANSSIIAVTGAAAGTVNRTFAGGGLTYSTLTVAAAAGSLAISGINTFGTQTVTGPALVSLSANQTVTTLNLNGTSGSEVFLTSSAFATQRTVTVTTLNAAWSAFRAINMTGTATSSFDLGNNANFTITAPAAGSAGMLVHPGMSGGARG